MTGRLRPAKNTNLLPWGIGRVLPVSVDSALTPERQAYNVANAQQRSTAIADAVRRAVPNASGLTLLDYGCGPGHIGLRLADHFGAVIMVDIDPVAVDQVRADATNLPNVDVQVMNASDADATTLHANVVVASLSLHHVEDIGRVLDGLARVAPGGRLFVFDMDFDGGAYHAAEPEYAHIVGFDRAELVSTVCAHGYQDVTIGDLWKGTKWVAGNLTPMSLFLLTATMPVAPGTETPPTV